MGFLQGSPVLSLVQTAVVNVDNLVFLPLDVVLPDLAQLSSPPVHLLDEYLRYRVPLEHRSLQLSVLEVSER